MRRLAVAALAVCFASPALAQAAPAAGPLPSPADVANRDSVTVGVGAAVIPDYEGSDDYRVIPAAAIRGKVSGFSFSTRGSYIYFDAIPHREASKVDFNLGPIIGLRLNKRTHIQDDVVDLLPARKTAIEAGGFAGVSNHQLTNPSYTLAFGLDVLHDIGSAHKSTVFSPNVEFSTPVSRRTYVSLSAGAEFVGNKYADYYYTITPADSVATGGVLPPFNADGGLKNWKLGLLVNQSITGDLLGGFSIFGAGQYSRLVGDFRRSPLVAQRGSAGQWLGALGLAYTW
jgi:outer membrane scaffolding protein for murein synthesis (MipA/OmpV family)